MLQVDALARRYGKWPHQVLELTPFELGLASQCAMAGWEKRGEVIERMQQQTKGGFMPLPVPTFSIDGA